jgi:peptidyl-prolyl cis-trans isomerase C
MSEKEEVLKKVVMVVLCLCIGLAACTKDGEKDVIRDTPVPSESEQGMEDADIIARVGDEPITRGDVEQILSQIPMQYRPRYSTPEGRRELVDAIVGMKMFAWEARRRGIPEQPDVKIKIDYMIDQILARALEEELRDNVSVEDKDIEKYYSENRENYVTPAMVKARHILVDTEEEALGILEKITSGADFAELAREKSKCPSADKGGDLGWFEKGKMDPAFEKAAFDLKKGEVSGVVKSSFGYHIIKVENTKTAKTKTLDQAKKSIERTMAKDLLAKQIAALRDKIKGEASVVVNEEYFSAFEKEQIPPESPVQEKQDPDTGQGE